MALDVRVLANGINSFHRHKSLHNSTLSPRTGQGKQNEVLMSSGRLDYMLQSLKNTLILP